MSQQFLTYLYPLHFITDRTCVYSLQLLSYCVQSKGAVLRFSFHIGCYCCRGFLQSSFVRGSYLSARLLFKFDLRSHYDTQKQESTHLVLHIDSSRSQRRLGSLCLEYQIIIVALTLIRHHRCKEIRKQRGCGSFRQFVTNHGRVKNSILHRITLHQFRLHLRYQGLEPICFLKQAHQFAPVLPRGR